LLWILGCVIYLLMMATGLHGLRAAVGPDVLLGRATVITGFFTAFPLVGEPGSSSSCLAAFAVGDPTLNRFFSLHYLLPFMIAGVVILHVWALHVTGQTNPTGVEVKSKTDTVAFTPYATIKDAFAMMHVLRGVRLFHLLHAELSRPCRTTTSRPTRW
jgi:ubiquinol-cytochrome c reductase cytochrome b subunit